MFIDYVFQSNTSGRDGFAITAYMSIATMTNCEFLDNSAKISGTIYSLQDDTALVNYTFHSNSSVNQDGAIKNDKCTITLTN
jgi:hypothetical protein